MDDPTDFVTEEQLPRHREERSVNGFSTYDWWNFNHYLAYVIIGGLEKFKTEAAGYPAQLSGFEEWSDVLQAIIDGFKAQLEMIEYRGDPAINKHLWERGSKLFIEHFPDLWD